MEDLKLRPYQQQDVVLLSKFPTAGCFNEQRTGKTPTALKTIAAKHLEDTKVIIITTKSSLYQWKYEYERWLQRPCVIAEGTPKRRTKLINESWTNGLIISIGALKETQRQTGYEALLLSKNPTMVILDEAHLISNPKTCSAKALYKFIRIPNRLALTGTPIQSKPEGLYGILHFLYPDIFKSVWAFRREYLQPEIVQFWNRDGLQTKQDYRNAKFSEIGELKIQGFLGVHCTQRKRKEVMKWLPEKDKQEIHIPLTKEQLKYLQDLEETFESDTMVTKGVLDRLIRYRQICNDPMLIGLKGTSPKTEWIIDFIKDNPETPVIIFSNFTEYLKKLFLILKEHSVKEALLIGDVDPKKRALFQKDFQEGKFNVFLINIKAGKEALTLDRAEAIIFTDVFPPHGDIAQAEDRFIATTKDKKDKPHTIYYLTMQDSYDETILESIKKQKTVADVVNDFKAQLIK